MIIFHGSDREIVRPDILHSRKEVDFGAGFYTTPLEEQAENWCRKFIRKGKRGIVSVYKQICFRRQEILDEYLKFERSYHV